jgi:NDP-sugar pyrophosphorylase family protein
MVTSAFPLAIILVGGLGTRLSRALPGTPKALAPAAGRPFLEWVLRFLSRQGLRRAVLATGHLGEQIEAFAEQRTQLGVELTVVHEPQPLGTGGAVCHALRRVGASSEPVLVCNGDSLALGDLRPLFAALGDPNVGAALFGVSVPDTAAFGGLDLAPKGVLRGFVEKRAGQGLINAGVYALRPEILSRFPASTRVSLEYDVFPSLLEAGVPIRVVASSAPFIDIGRESTLAQAGAFVSQHQEWFS